MEENKEIKKKKMPLYLIAIAIVLAVLGVMDLKVNAAEPLHFNYIKYYQRQFSSDYTQFTPFTPIVDTEFSYTGKVYIYHWDNTDWQASSGTNAQIIILSEGDIYGFDNAYEIEYAGKKYYIWSKFYSGIGWGATYGQEMILETNGTTTTYIRKLKDKPVFSTNLDFISMHVNDTLNYEKPPIDYDSFVTDNDLNVPKDFVVNKMLNKTSVDSGIGKVYFDEIFHYVNWKNTENMEIQVEVSPIVQFYEQEWLGFGHGNFVKNSSFNWQLMFLLENNTNSWTFETRESDVGYIDKDDPFEYKDTFSDVWVELRKEYDTSTLGDFSSFCTTAYRFRYIDVDNSKASPWVCVVPQSFDTWISYIVYADESESSSENSTGTSNKFNGSTLEDMIKDTDSENEFKDKYDIIDGDADVGEITNWLNSVIGFIKSSPSVIGSVLSFLPQPILYGLYITIFLGVFATAVGIIKALI